MKNRWIKTTDKKQLDGMSLMAANENLIDGLRLMARDDLVKLVIDGTKTPTKLSFMDQVEKELRFPTACAGKFSPFEDWIRDLSWFPAEKGVCIWITDYEDFMKEDARSKGIVEEILKDEVMPFWETEVIHNVKGGKPREFYVITS